MDWNKMVKMTVPVGLCGWQQRGSLTINGRTTEFPVGVETELPEPVAERIKALIADAEEKAEHVQPLKPWMQHVTGADGVARWEPRLAYTETKEVVILPEITTAGGPIKEWGSAPLVSGNEYTVICNGTEYVCVAQDLNAGVMVAAVGNPGLVGVEDDDNGLPFLIHAVPPEMGASAGVYAMLVLPDNDVPVTISIKGIVETIKPLDPKYLPSGSGGGFVVNATLTPTDDTGMTGTVTFDKTFEETLAAVKAGEYVSCHFELPGENETKNVVPNTSYNESHLGFVVQLGTIGVQIVMHIGGEHEYLFTSD